MLNKELESSLNGAFARARDKRHEFMTVEHLLLALLENDAAREALLACQADIDVYYAVSWILLSTRPRLLSPKMTKLARHNRR